MKKVSLLILLAVFITPAYAQTAADTLAITQAALDYIEGWYEGNGERMARAVHPELAKRIVRTNAEGRSSLGQMSAMTLVEATKTGYGAQTPANEQQKDVTILDIYQNAASVKLVARDFVDYLHVGKYNGEWRIVNVLWEMKPR